MFGFGNDKNKVYKVTIANTGETFEVNGKINFLADSEAIITKGIISILLNVFNNRKPQEILDSDMGFIEKIGLKEHLSPNRANGLSSMYKQIKFYALAFSKS